VSTRSLRTLHPRRTAAALVATALLAGIAPLAGQQVLLDQPIRAGDLILFPGVDDANVYYYVSDKPHLATDKSGGGPQFSFLRYVENADSGSSEAGLRASGGGGIVHALVALSVTPEQLAEARRALRRLKPGATLRGPVLFKSGTFGLVSSFTDPEGNLSHRVVGLGNAPLLDGEKAAVSMHLTQLGARILWQSFHTPTPDISFTFEMELDGYRSPRRAVIEADLDRIYEHRAFAAGLASTYLAAEIKGAFDDLREENAIRLTQVGDDEQLQALITTAYNRIAEMMFQPVQGTGTPDLASLAGSAGGERGLLDRATEMFERRREEARLENEGIRERNMERRRLATEQARARSDRLEEQLQETEASLRELEERLAALETRSGLPEGVDDLNRDITEGLQDRATRLRERATETREERDRLESEEDEAEPEDLEEEVEAPSFALVAAYEMKRVRQHGVYRIDLNKFSPDTLTLRFDENIGDLRRFLGDASYFREVNLDDPLYVQREVRAFVDGLNAEDFGNYINFVTVGLRKRHEAGEETYDEVRIDRENFNREGNNFVLMYGWKGDRNRSRWMSYDYRLTWSFFGGSAVEDPDWRQTTSGAIDLVPPYQRRQVTIEADPGLLAAAEVRSATIRIYYRLGDQERVQTATLNPAQGELSKVVEFMLPADTYDYDYEVSWRLLGNRSVSSGRQRTNESILYVDEVPGA